MQFGGLRIASLLFANAVVLMASLFCDLQLSLDWLASKCEATGMRISTSKSEALVLCRKQIDCLLLVGNESSSLGKEFRYVRVLFLSEGTMEHEMGWRIGTVRVVLYLLYRTFVMKRELSQRAKFLIFPSSFLPTLTHGHQG